MNLSSRVEGKFVLIDEVLEEIRDWTRELKRVTSINTNIYMNGCFVGWMIKVKKYFDAEGIYVKKNIKYKILHNG